MSEENLTLAEMADRGRVRASATLTILSLVDPPALIAELVGLAADDHWRQGQPRGLLRKPAAYHGVNYESQIEEDRSPSDHLEALVARLASHATKIREVGERPGTESMAVRVAEHTYFDNPEAWSRPGDLEVLSAMGVWLGFDTYLYFHDDDDDVEAIEPDPAVPARHRTR